MAYSRFVLHPLLKYKRSRNIFFLFLGVSIIVGALLWWRMDQVLSQAGINIIGNYSSDKWYLVVLLSPHFKYSMILLSAVLAGALTAHHVIGPVGRIGSWIQDWGSGANPSELRVRKNDKFSTFVRLINELKNKFSPPSEKP